MIRRSRGNALAVAVAVALLLLGVAAVLVKASVTARHEAAVAEAKLQARTVALSGLNRALLELEASVGGLCSHVTTGDARSCYGNVDGRVDASSVFDLATNPRGVKNRNLAVDMDALDLDAAKAGPDGWVDFRDQSATRPGVALSASVAGVYTVRTRTEGRTFRIRAYGSALGEVAGLEAVVVRAVELPLSALSIGRAGYRIASLADVPAR